MFTEAELGIVRAAYAKQVMAAGNASNGRVETAFATVHREDFLGAGPWPICRHYRTYVRTPSADPVFVYTDDLIGLLPHREINNGQPSFHAHLLAMAEPSPGEHVVHIGAGTGYYTALMAELVGSSGHVTSIEFDPELASRAKNNLSTRANVTIVQGDGALADFAAADVIYVNAGATRPADTWLDRLADGGRLILPLTTSKSFAMPDENLATRGAVFLIERRGDDLHARWISPVAIFPCAGARDETSERALAAALQTGRWAEVTRLYRRDDLPDTQCFLKAPGWCLAYS